MYKTLIGFDKNLAIIHHHYALLGTFFQSLEIEPEYLNVTTNVNGVFDWEYTLPFNMVAEVNHKKNIYANKNVLMPNFILKFRDSWLVRSIPSTEEKELSLKLILVMIRVKLMVYCLLVIVMHYSAPIKMGYQNLSIFMF
jgi:hypothetical protein